jgi:predicted RNase H-like nuclease (RuvC/YqgF family)
MSSPSNISLDDQSHGSQGAGEQASFSSHAPAAPGAGLAALQMILAALIKVDEKMVAGGFGGLSVSVCGTVDGVDVQEVVDEALEEATGKVGDFMKINQSQYDHSENGDDVQLKDRQSELEKEVAELKEALRLSDQAHLDEKAKYELDKSKSEKEMQALHNKIDENGKEIRALKKLIRSSDKKICELEKN